MSAPTVDPIVALQAAATVYAWSCERGKREMSSDVIEEQEEALGALGEAALVWNEAMNAAAPPGARDKDHELATLAAELHRARREVADLRARIQAAKEALEP